MRRLLDLDSPFFRMGAKPLGAYRPIGEARRLGSNGSLGFGLILLPKSARKLGVTNTVAFVDWKRQHPFIAAEFVDRWS